MNLILGLALMLNAGVAVDDLQVVHPKTIESKLDNPHMGFIYYGGKLHPDIADVYYTSGLTWGELEPEEGKYIWDLHAPPWGTLKAALARGKRVVIRVMPSFQNHPYATPKWVHDLGVKRFPGTKIQAEHGQTDLYEPEWWNPIYIEKYCNFIKAFGKEFDGKPWLDWVDMRYYGFWGEGHRHSADVPWPEDIDKRKTLIRFIDAHLDAFKSTPLVVQMASDQATPYPSGTAIDYALEHGCWMRRDGFGPYISEEEAVVMKGHWKTSVMIAENGGYYKDFAAGKISRWWEEGSKPISLEACLDQMLEFHCNYIPLGWGDPDWPVMEARPALLKMLWMNMGYRLVPNEVQFHATFNIGESTQIQSTWTNTGAGRLPKAYPLAWYLLDEKEGQHLLLTDEEFDATAWYKNKQHTFTHELSIADTMKPGTYTLAVALVDPKTGVPAIALGIEGGTKDRYYSIASVTLK
jgi:hypothetical protein